MNKLLFVSIFCLAIYVMSCKKNNFPAAVTDPALTSDTAIIRVTGVNLSSSSVLLLPIYTQQLTAAIIPSNAFNTSIVWSSSNTAIATVGATGLVTALAEGMAIVTAASAGNPVIKTSATIYIRKPYDMYVVGNGPTQRYTNEAIFWKNGNPSSLNGGQNYPKNAFSILLSGNNMYIAGTTVNSDGWSIPTYWKNGEPVQLAQPVDAQNNIANSIAVSGNNIYVSGYVTYQPCNNCNVKFAASYWKINGGSVTQVPLVVTGDSSTQAFSVAVAGNDVYVVGMQFNNIFSYAKLWKNNLTGAVSLSNGTSWSQANAIAIRGNDVYVAGVDGCPYTNCPRTVKLWKNSADQSVALSSGSSDAYATSITIAGTDIYVAGYETSVSGKNVAKFWKVSGTSITSLAVTTGETDAVANAIAVSGDDVFLAGSEIDKTGKKVAKCWRTYNDAVLPFTLQTAYLPFNSTASGICIQ